ncbi:MAG TPA: hypothetical protein VMK65_09245, partial [Longimicrobiales bacterium]|nr:hypothetical protein [Longimicrobiales bacterium]
MTSSQLRERFRAARTDPALAVLEGLHPLKHALRFGAEPLEVVSPDPDRLLALARALAPDLTARLGELVRPLGAELFAALAPSVPSSPVLALARRPTITLDDALAHAPAAPAVVLEDPTHAGNIGAVVRVAAAAGAAA